MKVETADAFNATELDEVVHGRVRLGVLAYLAGAGEADFNTLRDHLKTTNGNLSVHLGKLEGAGYVELRRTIAGKRTRTVVRPTATGRAALKSYVDHLARLVEQMG